MVVALSCIALVTVTTAISPQFSSISGPGLWPLMAKSKVVRPSQSDVVLVMVRSKNFVWPEKYCVSVSSPTDFCPHQLDRESAPLQPTSGRLVAVCVVFPQVDVLLREVLVVAELVVVAVAEMFPEKLVVVKLDVVVVEMFPKKLVVVKLVVEAEVVVVPL